MSYDAHMRWLIAFLVACGGSGSDNPSVDAPEGIDAPPADAPPVTMFDPLVGIGQVELVRGGYMFTEGPQWRAAQQDLLFSDIPANTIYRHTTGVPVVHEMPSGNANGLAIDGNGALIAAEHGTRSVTRNNTMIATMFEGQLLNSPNDVVVADDGTIYFTDPPYGLGGRPRGVPFNGVYRLATNGTLFAEHRGDANGTRPNGIGLSPDGKTLYVADTIDGRVYKFAVAADGATSGRTMFAMTTGGPDGLAIDTGGNVFVTSNSGIEVFAPSGQKWGTIAVAMLPANCAFGDADAKTLYITARTSLYKVRLANAGLPRR